MNAIRRLRASAVALGAFATVAVAASPERNGVEALPGSGPSAFRLLGAARNILLAANRVSCNVDNVGLACVSATYSPVVGGGFWPAGTGDEYIYNGGLQVAALVASDAGFAWAGDTIGAVFMDPRGVQQHGEALAGLVDSRRASDYFGWPAAAFATDTSLFDPSLIGRAAISDQDTWTRYWDGNPSLTYGRGHMMGVLVDQRTLAFNRPWANRDIVYFIYRLINITSREPSDYAGLAAAGYSAAAIAEIAALGQQFQMLAQERDTSLHLPVHGFTFSRMYVNYFQDPDIGNAGFNNSTVSLPFAMGFTFKSDFSEPSWTLPPEIFGQPFARAPGMSGVQLVRGFRDSATASTNGLVIWSNTCGGCGILNDAVNVRQLYRYISGRPSTALGDASCSVQNPLVYHVCGQIVTPHDTRFFQSTGPLDLGPGRSAVLVYALDFAASVDTEPASGSGIYALPAFSLAPYITPGIGTMGVGVGATPETLAVVGASKVRRIDRASGWAGFSDANGNGRIEPDEVRTVPYSLLHKAQVARAVLANRFLVPEAPEPPLFYLVAGDGQVTIAWQRSSTEATGDPYFAVASDPLSALSDRDYRQFDVEGYRIWRGRSTTDLRVIAQFDYGNTTFADYTGQLWYNNTCAPELGLTSGCPGYPYVVPIDGDLVQVPPGGRVLLADGSVLTLRADTAVTGGGSGFPRLTGKGVPFAFVDAGLQNGFTYFYAVSAFDVNSIASTPSSLESQLIVKAVTPRATSSNTQPAVLVTGLYGEDGVQLNPLDPPPTIDAATGVWSGTVPPSNALDFKLLASVVEALPQGDITAHIDSIRAGTTSGFGPAPVMYVSLSSGADTIRTAIQLEDAGYYFINPMERFSWRPFSVSTPLVRYDATRAAALGITDARFLGGARMSVELGGVIQPPTAGGPNYTMMEQRYPWGSAAAYHHSAYLNQAVWYDEGSAAPPQPTINPYPSAANTNGKLTGVASIYSPQVYRQPPGSAVNQVSLYQRYVNYGTPLWHPGDFVVTWNADSTITVRDTTHHVALPFRPDYGASWGFINERALVAAGTTAGQLDDGTGTVNIGVVGYHHEYAFRPVCDVTWQSATCAALEPKAEFQPIDNNNDGAADGNGIMLYINGMFFIMQMNALPAAGTKWHLKAPGGILDATCPTYFPATPAAVPASCSGYTFSDPMPYRSGEVPNLSVKLRVTQGYTIARASGNLSRVHTVPDPYYYVSAFETTVQYRQLRFVNLPDRAIIRIYSASGILVAVLQHNDPTGGGEEPWDLTSRNGRQVASGIYFFHVEGPDGATHVGRLTIVNRR